MIDFRLGDIIEFRDAVFSKGKWTEHKDTYVDRLHLIIKNLDPDPDEQSEFELWCDHYSEVPGRMYVTPERVIRIIEKGHTPCPLEYHPPVLIGQKVSYIETIDKRKVRVLDSIAKLEFRFDKEGVSWKYHLKESKYAMDCDELEFL